MKAIVWTAYGPPEGLQLREVETPVPKADEIRIRVRATTVSAGDAGLRRMQLPPPFSLIFRLYVGLDRPRRITILGQEIAGEVDAVGANVTRFKSGDAVFGTPGLRLGGYAEFAIMRATGTLAIKPPGVGYEEAATLVVGGIEALHGLRQVGLQAGEKILINGAGGSIGTYAVQLAVNLGAEVTAVDRGSKLEMLRSIGADHVIDYTRENFAGRGERFDAAFDVIGKASFAGVVRSLKPGGRFAVGNPQMVHRLRRGWAEKTRGVKVFNSTAIMSEENWIYLAGQLEAGRIRAVIDRVYPLEQTAEAHRYAETGEKKGHIVITVP